MPGLKGSKSGLGTFRPAHPPPAKAVPAHGAAGSRLSSARLARSERFLFPTLPLSGEIYEGLIVAIRNQE